MDMICWNCPYYDDALEYCEKDTRYRSDTDAAMPDWGPLTKEEIEKIMEET